MDPPHGRRYQQFQGLPILSRREREKEKPQWLAVQITITVKKFARSVWNNSSSDGRKQRLNFHRVAPQELPHVSLTLRTNGGVTTVMPLPTSSVAKV